MRNASGHPGENEWQRKKDYVVFVQNNGREMYKKSVLHVQSCVFAD